PAEAVIAGRPVRAGSRVRLRLSAARPRADIMDLVLDGRAAVVESIEQDDEGALHFAVTLDDDPGRDLGEARMPGHRFFYSAEEIEPMDGEASPAPATRILVAGIGNIFLGDDGFGVEVVRRLAETQRTASTPGAGGARGATDAPDMAGTPDMAGVDVVDFGIRGMDLAYALQRDYDLAILVDAAPRGEAPGTLTVLEADLSDLGAAGVEAHGMDPVRVLRLAREMGRVPDRVVVVCCEPATALAGGPDEDVLVELSEPVRSAVGQAVRLLMDMIAERAGPGSPPQNTE
uniref:hydrogenase maturation protease n=1 Tax=Nonomuraea lactucae TaxID=2249762 RepID=UPI001F069C61